MNKSGNVVTPLGNYITLVTRKNKNLEVTKLVGVTVEKEIITSIATGRNTNLQICLIVEFGNFVVRLMNIEMTGRLAIGLYEKADKVIVSSQYHVFKITNPLLNKHYLMMIFQKEVTELQLLYRCFGGIRGELAWKDFVKLPISVPSLDKQKRIVKKYQTITRYIELKRRINELFEKQMTAYFHILFDNLTNYTIKNFGELFTIIRGGRPPRGNLEQEKKYFCKEGGIPWLQVGDISRKNYKFVSETADQLTPEGFKRGRCTMLRGGHILFIHHAQEKQIKNVTINEKELCCTSEIQGLKPQENIGVPFLFYLLKENIGTILRKSTASTKTETVKKEKLTLHPIKFPSQTLINKFNNFCEPIFELQKSNEQIIKRLLRMQKCWVESLD